MPQKVVHGYRALRRDSDTARPSSFITDLCEDLHLLELRHPVGDRVPKAHFRLFDEHHRGHGREGLRHRIVSEYGILRHRLRFRGVDVAMAWKWTMWPLRAMRVTAPGIVPL